MGFIHIPALSRRSLMKKEPDTPQGTVALLLVYLVIVVALWGTVFLTMLSRGVTQ
jgi:hypothetical protein